MLKSKTAVKIETYNKIIEALFWVILLFFSPLVILSLNTFPVAAQESVPTHIFITDSQVESIPTIELRVYGLDALGNPLDFAANLPGLNVTHGPQSTNQLEITGQEQVGTFTIFLVDTPPGVSGQLADIQEAILAYTADYQTEPLDYVALYQVGATTADPLLPPTEFRNSVRNFFVDPLPTESGPTALIDSIVSLLNEMNGIAPNPNQAMQIVVFSDGTDVVSRQFNRQDVIETAASLGIPIHTIWLRNANLIPAEEGVEFLAQVARESGGISASLEDDEDLSPIWRRIDAFGAQTLLSYSVPEIMSGTYSVTLSVAVAPNVLAETTVNIPDSAPSIRFEIPPESRILTLPEIGETVSLMLPTQIRWLDGQERPITQAQLFVNGAMVQELDVENLSQIEAEIPNLNFGENRLQVAIVDGAVSRATTSELILTVNQGDERIIPDLLQPASTFPWLWTIIALAAVLVLGVVLLRNRQISARLLGLLPNVRRRRRSQAAVIEDGGNYVPQTAAPISQPTSQANAGSWLEVLDSVSRVVSPIELTGIELRLGRSLAQSDITFENDITVSRIHASLVREGNDYRLYDEQSTSGTQVNGVPVPDYGVQLLDGDEILMGAVRLRYRKE